MIIRLVEDGGGVATLPRVLVDRANNPRLRILRCPTQLEPLPLWLSWRPQRNNRAAAEALAQLLAFLGDLGPGEAAKHRAVRRS